MIFKPGLVEKILAGKKSQTRRPVKAHELACPFDASRTATTFEPGCRYVPGRDYSLQRGRKQPGIGPRLLVTGVRLEQLGDLTPQGAIAEGFRTTDRFFDYWERLYGRVDLEQWVWAISFDVVHEERMRYLGRRGGYTEEPQFALAEDPGQDSKVRAWAPPASWQEDHSRRRRVEFEDERAKELDERLAAALQEAEDQGLDVGRHRAAIGKRVDALERELRRAKTRAAA